MRLSNAMSSRRNIAKLAYYWRTPYSAEQQGVAALVIRDDLRNKSSKADLFMEPRLYSVLTGGTNALLCGCYAKNSLISSFLLFSLCRIVQS